MRASKRLCQGLRLAINNTRPPRIPTHPSLLSRAPYSPALRCSPYSRPFELIPPSTIRWNSSITAPSSPPNPTPPTTAPPPSYALTFTCEPCGHRSSHRITKQGYHHGTVLIQCPQCKVRHVISDHLKIFLDEKSTLEDIMKRKHGDLSKLLKKGKLGIRQGALVGNEGEEDIEFWEDGTETRGEAQKEVNRKQE